MAGFDAVGGEGSGIYWRMRLMRLELVTYFQAVADQGCTTDRADE